MASPTVLNNGQAGPSRIGWRLRDLRGALLHLLAASVAALTLALPIVLNSATAWAILIDHDTRDFEGIPWGATFEESDTFKKVDDTGRLKAYELTNTTPTLGGIAVDSMRFYTALGHFARVAVRYHDKVTHERIVKYLEERYGELDRTPGQIAAGLVKFHNWHGDETDVTLRYETRTDQGVIFFESQVWAPQLSEGNSPSGF